MLGQAKSGPARDALRRTEAILSALFSTAGAEPLVLPHLFPGETLLDLYGEDLRARAFLFADAERGEELCLRPDFTVPVALQHAAGGWDRQAAYCYFGPVFRRQPPGQGRPVEYLQAGIERFGDPEPVASEASVFAVLTEGVRALGIDQPVPTIGDLSVPFALLDTLEMPARRRAALRRHFWRPTRFQDLITRAVTPPAPSDRRAALIAAADDPATLNAMIGGAGETVGLRTEADIRARIRVLRDAQAEPRMPAAEAKLIADLMAVHGPAPRALTELRRITGAVGGAVASTVDLFELRLDLLSGHGVDPAALTYHADFGRNLEYYDGFVFELRAPGGKAHPPLAGGGRYDSMTVRLGASAPVAAIGGIIRPEAVQEVAR